MHTRIAAEWLVSSAHTAQHELCATGYGFGVLACENAQRRWVWGRYREQFSVASRVNENVNVTLTFWGLPRPAHCTLGTYPLPQRLRLSVDVLRVQAGGVRMPRLTVRPPRVSDISSTVIARRAAGET